jgi:glycosyltransferase involved in cell wall biosynthesis
MISIVIPTKNEARQIRYLLDSIVAQDLQEEYEVVVADKDSTDGTRDIVESYRGKIKNLKIVEGGTPAVARNNGGRASTGDPIYFIDADVTLHKKDFLRVNTEYFRSHHLAVAATKIWPDSKNWIDWFMTGVNNAYLPFARYIWYVGAVCIIASRYAFEKTGGYPEDRFQNEDHDFAGMCAHYGAWGYAPLPILMSVRRMEKEGRFRLMWKYSISALYRVFIGPVTKPIFKYEFSYTEKEEKR